MQSKTLTESVEKGKKRQALAKATRGSRNTRPFKKESKSEIMREPKGLKDILLYLCYILIGIKRNISNVNKSRDELEKVNDEKRGIYIIIISIIIEEVIWFFFSSNER
jgi:hypothetical protein